MGQVMLLEWFNRSLLYKIPAQSWFSGGQLQTVRKLVQNLLPLRDVLRHLSPDFGINCFYMLSLTG